jgi:hypothetical protein
MSCPIHWNDGCTCYNGSLQYTTSITTTASSQFVPQAGNILVGYELASPLDPTSGAWHPVESVIIQPAPCSGQESSQSDRYRLANTYETLPLHNGYRREFHVHGQQQKAVSLSQEQVGSLILNVQPRAYIKSVGHAPSVQHTVHPRRYSSHAQQLLRTIGTISSCSSKWLVWLGNLRPCFTSRISD